MGRVLFNLYAMVPDANLYITLSKELGLQFLIRLLSILPFGIQVTKHWRNDVDNFPL